MLPFLQPCPLPACFALPRSIRPPLRSGRRLWYRPSRQGAGCSSSARQRGSPARLACGQVPHFRGEALGLGPLARSLSSTARLCWYGPPPCQRGSPRPAIRRPQAGGIARLLTQPLPCSGRHIQEKPPPFRTVEAFLISLYISELSTFRRCFLWKKKGRNCCTTFTHWAIFV